MDKNVLKGHSKIMTFLISGNFKGSMKVHYIVYLVPYVQFFLHLTSGAKEEDIQKQILKKNLLFDHKSLLKLWLDMSLHKMWPGVIVFKIYSL
jgi:hypothetical protein